MCQSKEFGWDFQQGTASIAAGSKLFHLAGIILNTRTCIGENISIYGATSTRLTGRAPNGGSPENRYAPLTATIESCSDATHGTVVVAATRTVATGGVCPPLSGETAAIPFSDGCTRVGHDVSVGINTAFKTQRIVRLPANSHGFAANTINIGTNHGIIGKNTHIYNGWLSGYSLAHPAGLNVVNIVGNSHNSRVNNAKVVGVFLDNGLDFNWNMLGNGEPAGIYISYASNVYIGNSTLSNTLRGIGVVEDADSIVLSKNNYYNNHEDSEHFGESYVAGDSVSNVTSFGAHLYGYSDDGIAIVGGALPCANPTSTGDTAVTNVVVDRPVIVGSNNSGGGRIYNCAVQLAGNLNGVRVLSPEISHPGYCSIAVEDYGGGAPQNVYVSGGTASYGTTLYPQSNITSSPIVISSQTVRNYPSCLPAVASGIQFDSMLIDAGDSIGIVAFSYGVSSVKGACFSVIGDVDNLLLRNNTCHNDAGATGNYGVWLGVGSKNVTLQNNRFNFVGNGLGVGASYFLHVETTGTVVSTGNTVTYIH